MGNPSFGWRLEGGVASPVNFVLLLLVLSSFPLVLHETGALAVATFDPDSPGHTPAFLRFCVVVALFLWTCFAIALIGIYRQGSVGFAKFIGFSWHHWRPVIRDIGIALLALLAMAMVGNLSNTLLGPLQRDSAAYHSMVADNTSEALAFLMLALTAGFVEEFVFRGYIQKQCQALLGNTSLAAMLQLMLFTLGHLYQGWTRLLPVLLIGIVLTGVALWRKSLVPGMIAHSLGDSLVAFSFFHRCL
jgi:membrane protease YdiL (CAAX protease family)